MKVATSLSQNSPSQNIIVYVLAFKQDKTRRDLMRQRLAEHGLEVSFIDAVRGATLSEGEKAIFSTSGRQYWTDHLFQDGAIGCSLSHFKAWQALLDSEQSCALVLEDDALPISEAIAPCIKALVAMADRLDIVTLANRHNKRKQIKVADIQQGRELSVLRYNSFGAESYFITRAAAQHLLNHPKLYVFEVDRLIHHWWHHDCQVLHLSPWLFEEDGRSSSIGYKNVRTWQDDNLSHEIIRRFNRAWDSFIKRLYFRPYINNIKRRLADSSMYINNRS